MQIAKKNKNFTCDSIPIRLEFYFRFRSKHLCNQTVTFNQSLTLFYYNVNRVIKMFLPKLKNLREDHDLTQQYVANYLKINRVVYIRYEKGIREIPISLLIRLSKLYNVSIDYIVDTSNQQKSTY